VHIHGSTTTAPHNSLAANAIARRKLGGGRVQSSEATAGDTRLWPNPEEALAADFVVDARGREARG
jgi:hypothetical protein